MQSPLGIDPVHYLNNRLAGKDGVTQFDLTTRRLTGNGRRPPKYANLIVYSQYLTRNMQDNYKTGTIFCNRWEDVISKLRDLHPGDPKIAVYPYAGMQHQEIELDG